MNFATLSTLIEQKYIDVQEHPTAPLFIYNYSQLAQYERNWNEWTLSCRGLILNDKNEVVARPFAKFFNIEEHQPNEIPQENFEVYEKLDGSLGILYHWDNQFYMASRGSFDSVQARRANEILRQKYTNILPRLNPAKTYLFEIIYPENRIVVDYGAMEDVVLLAIIDTQTGVEESLTDIGFPLVKRYDGIKDIHQLKQLNEANREGFVIKFRSGFRVKVKFEEYVRLHRIITQVSSKDIWLHLANEEPLDKLLDKVPDEFYRWVQQTITKLRQEYSEIENYCQKHFKILPTRKETALYFLTLKYNNVLFAMLDNKDYSPLIWKMIEPPFEKPFANVGE